MTGLWWGARGAQMKIEPARKKRVEGKGRYCIPSRMGVSHHFGVKSWQACNADGSRVRVTKDEICARVPQESIGADQESSGGLREREREECTIRTVGAEEELRKC